MELFRIRRDIPFMKHALVLNAISAITFIAAVIFLVTRGLNLSVEFTGGTVMEVAYEQPADLSAVRQVVESLGYAEVPVQNFGTSRDVLLRLPVQAGKSSGQQSEVVLAALKAQNPAVELRRTEFVGPQVGQELVEDGLKALGLVIVGIMIYLAMRFEWKYAVSAIIANLHDVVIILGFFAFFQWEFSLAVLAAVLAVLTVSGRAFAATARKPRPRSSTTRSRPPSAAPSSPTALRKSWCCRCCCSAARRCITLRWHSPLAFCSVSIRRCLWRLPLRCGWASSARI